MNISFVIPTEAIEEFAKAIPQLSNLRIIFVEFNGYDGIGLID